MAEQAIHLKQAVQNLLFLAECKRHFDAPLKYPDWYVTVRFYACLHLVEVIVASLPLHFGSHNDRNEGIYKLTTLFDKDFCNHFNDLFNLSFKARYLMGGKVNAKDVSQCDRSFDYVMDFAEKKHKIYIREKKPAQSEGQESAVT